MTPQTYSYFSKIYIAIFASMLGFCVFFRHGVEHSRYILMVLSFIFFITHKKYIKKLCTSDSFLALLSFFTIALTSLILNSAPLSHIDEVINWIAIFISGYVAAAIAKEKSTDFILVVPVVLLAAIVIFPGATGAGWEHLNILSAARLTLYFQEKANHLGLICGMFAFAASYYGFRSSGRARVLAFLLSGICFLLLFRTAARASFLGTVAIFAGWMLWQAQKRRKEMLLAILLAGSCAIAVLYFSPLNHNRIISSVTKGLHQDRSFLQRFFTWNVAYTNFTQSPLIGKGFDSFSEQYEQEIKKYENDPEYKRKFPLTIPSTNNAHNFFLHFLAETGITGLIAILWFWITVVRKGFQINNKISTPVAGMFLISMIAFQMNMSMYGLQISTILFAFAGLSACQTTNNIPCTHSHSKSEITANKHNSHDNNVNIFKL